MRIIDVHTHAWVDQLAEKAVGALRGDATITWDPMYDGTISGLIAEMDRTGVDISVIQPVSTKPSQVPAINDWAASVDGGRIVAFGSMHPDFDDPASEIARMKGLGLRGFKMHPEHQSFAPDEHRLDAIWQAAIDNGMIVLFHAGADVIHPTVRGTADSFARLIEAWPHLRAILAHMGGYQQWSEVERHLSGSDVWLDTAYVLGHLPDEQFVELVRAHGVDKVMFGTDGPWTNAARELEHLSRLGFSESELAGILGGNAERLLGLA